MNAHKFEIAGLGIAPFTCVGAGREVFQAVPGDSSCPIQPGTSCDFCGQGIMNVFYIRSSDGKRFKVGGDCVAKTGDDGLCKVVDRETAKRNRAARTATNARKQADLAATLADEATRAMLAAKPHPNRFQAKAGATMLDWAEWMAKNAGATGRAKTLKTILAA